MTTHRCEAQTRNGGRRKSKAVVYHRQHHDGAEYLACLRHNNEHFRPAVGIVARPPENLASA